MSDLSLTADLERVLNRHGAENQSGTPDYILAKYLMSCLDAYNEAVQTRAAWRNESVDIPSLERILDKPDDANMKPDLRTIVPDYPTANH